MSVAFLSDSSERSFPHVHRSGASEAELVVELVTFVQFGHSTNILLPDEQNVIPIRDAQLLGETLCTSKPILSTDKFKVELCRPCMVFEYLGQVAKKHLLASSAGFDSLPTYNGRLVKRPFA